MYAISEIDFEQLNEIARANNTLFNKGTRIAMFLWNCSQRHCIAVIGLGQSFSERECPRLIQWNFSASSAFNIAIFVLKVKFNSLLSVLNWIKWLYLNILYTNWANLEHERWFHVRMRSSTEPSPRMRALWISVDTRDCVTATEKKKYPGKYLLIHCIFTDHTLWSYNRTVLWRTSKKGRCQKVIVALVPLRVLRYYRKLRSLHLWIILLACSFAVYI